MKLFKIFSVCFIITFLSGCSKSFLNKNDPQSLPIGTVITDYKSLVNSSTGVYNYFQSTNYYNRSFILIPELMADNVFISIRNVGFYLNYDDYSINDADGYALGAWASMYGVIGSANRTIAGGESLTYAPALQADASHVIGEMYAARALAHFDLVRLFAQPYNYTADASHPGVPIVTKPQSEVIAPARNTVKEVYLQITDDFKKAITLMSGGKKNGRFTRGAAKALLSKVYLYMEDWENAEKYATDVIGNEPYTPLATDEYVASWANDFSTESLFEIGNLPGDRPAVNGIGAFFEQGAYGDALATGDIYDTYSATDIRRDLIEAGVRDQAENPAYIVHKYPKGNTSQDDNIKVIRLSEVYLIRAEARAEQGGEDDLAQDDLNFIIQRADPLAAPVTLTGDALVNRIILERRKELAFEGNRLFDLTRKKMNVTHIEAEKTTVIDYPDGRLILPIPRDERIANPTIGQNPYYIN